MFYQSVPQECLTRVCHKSVTQECPTVREECQARVFCKSGFLNAIGHLLFAFYCSVGTLLLREFLKMHSGAWFLSGSVVPHLPGEGC